MQRGTHDVFQREFYYLLAVRYVREAGVYVM